MGLIDKELLDKARDAAQQAVAQAQLGIAQGQARLDAYQIKRRADALLRDLGAAYYAELRSGGPQDAVSSAAAAVDRHVATHGPIDAMPTPTTAPPSSSTEGAPTASTTASTERAATAPSTGPETGAPPTASTTGSAAAPPAAPTGQTADPGDPAPPPGRTGTYTLDDV